jgi:phosphatidylglycerophosphate synthase
MLPASFIVVAVLLRLASGASYFKATWDGIAKPSIISWFFWSITALIAFAVQLVKGAGPEAFVTLAIGISPIAVCIAALHKGGYKIALSYSDKWCIFLTIIGIILWLVSKDPLMALLMSILADIFSSVPTILKSYRDPESEHPTAYILSIVSMAVTLLAIHNWQLSHWLFTAYILGINLTYVLTITVFSKFRRAEPIPKAVGNVA